MIKKKQINQGLKNHSQYSNDHLNNLQPMSLSMIMINIFVNDIKLKASPLRLGIRQECPLSPFLFNIVQDIITTEKCQLKEIIFKLENK